MIGDFLIIFFWRYCAYAPILAATRNLFTDHGRNIECKDSSSISNVTYINIKYNAVLMAETCDRSPINMPWKEEIHTHAIVEVETIWLFRNLRKPFKDTQTSYSSSGSRSSSRCWTTNIDLSKNVHMQESLQPLGLTQLFQSVSTLTASV